MERFLKDPLCQACVPACITMSALPPPTHPPPTHSVSVVTSSYELPCHNKPCGHEYSGGEAAALPAERGAPARGSPETTPCYRSIWALSALPTPPPTPQDPRWPTGRPPCPLCHSDWGGSPAKRAGVFACGPICVGSEVTARPGGGCHGRSRQPAAQTVGTRFNWRTATGRRMALLPRRTGQTFPAYFRWTFVEICDI